LCRCVVCLTRAFAACCDPRREPQTVFYTSLRKFATLCLSYALFPKPITPQHVLGAVLLCAGIYMNDKVCACGWSDTKCEKTLVPGD
jgi:hypothetical protein